MTGGEGVTVFRGNTDNHCIIEMTVFLMHNYDKLITVYILVHTVQLNKPIVTQIKLVIQ